MKSEATWRFFFIRLHLVRLAKQKEYVDLNEIRGRYIMENVSQLLEQYLNIVNSEENQRNKAYWLNAEEPYLAERWRGISSRKTNTPFTMAMDISGYSKMLDIDCFRYYTDAEEQLRHQLRYAIWEFRNLRCHRYFENTVFISFGSVFEASMFGAEIFYLHDQAPWVDERNHLLDDKKTC